MVEQVTSTAFKSLWKENTQIGVAAGWNTLMDCQWEDCLGITLLSDLLGIKTTMLKKDKLKAENKKLAVIFEQLEHHRALNGEGDYLYSSAGNRSNFYIKGSISGKKILPEISTNFGGFFELQIELLCFCDSIKCFIYTCS